MPLLCSARRSQGLAGVPEAFDRGSFGVVKDLGCVSRVSQECLGGASGPTFTWKTDVVDHRDPATAAAARKFHDPEIRLLVLPFAYFLVEAAETFETELVLSERSAGFT